MASSKLDISVIVCHHTGTLITGFLKSLNESVNVKFETLLVTSYKMKEIKPLLQGYVRVIDSTSAMPAKKRNMAATHAEAKYLAFFDDDVEVTPTCLYEMKKYLDENLDTGMVYAKTLNMEHRNRFDEAGSYLTWTGFLWSRAEQHLEDKGQYDYVAPVLAGKSAACMIRTEDFFKVGKFDQDFGILGEETDLSWRVWLSGKWVCYVPQAVAYHAFNTKFKPRDKHYTDTRVYYNGCRNYITMLLKNLETRNLWILAIHVPIWVTAGFAMLFTGRLKPAWNILSGMWYVLRNLPSLLRKRHAVQKQRVRDDRAIWAFITARPHGGYYLQRFTRYIKSTLHG